MGIGNHVLRKSTAIQPFKPPMPPSADTWETSTSTPHKPVAEEHVRLVEARTSLQPTREWKEIPVWVLGIPSTINGKVQAPNIVRRDAVEEVAKPWLEGQGLRLKRTISRLKKKNIA